MRKTVSGLIATLAFSILGTIISGGNVGAISFDFTGPQWFSLDPVLTGQTDASTIDYNIISEGEPLWGYDGLGVIFPDEEYLMKKNDGSLDYQTRVAKRGESVRVSTKLETALYHDDTTSWPMTAYQFQSLFPRGVAVDESSVIVKVDGAEIDGSGYTVSVEDVPTEEAEMTGYYLSVSIGVKWAEITRSSNTFTTEFLYDEGAEIEIEYALRANSNAGASISFANVHGYDYVYSSNGNTRNTQISDIKNLNVLIDGNLVIKRVDKNGAPLAGAKFAVEGVKAKESSTVAGAYEYDRNGSISEFVTDENGRVIITGLPLKDYTVTEAEAPAGHVTEDKTKTRTVAWEDLVNIDYNEEKFMLAGLMDLTPYLQSIGDDMYVYDMSQTGYEMTYDATTGEYKNSSLLMTARKGTDGNYILDGALGDDIETTYWDDWGGYVAVSTLSDYLTAESSHVSYPDIGDYLVKNNDGTITIRGMKNDDSETVFTSKGDGCYSADGSALFGGEGEALLCETENDEYQLVAPLSASSGMGKTVGAHFKYLDKLSRYVIDYPYSFNLIREKSEQAVEYRGLTVIKHYPKVDKYYMSLGGPSMAQYEVERQLIPHILYANEVVFTDIESSDSESEGVPENPQTADNFGVIALAFGIVAVSGGFLARRQLRR
ncbi:hypothetical protein IJJ54_01750 [Candidatus Saccharibacteria bacterium]|nr:hypothetical protein [Candidatus Saccharibacteria bacterium]